MKVGTFIIVGLAGVIGYFFVVKGGFFATTRPATATSSPTSGNQVVAAQGVFAAALGMANTIFSSQNTTAQTTPLTT